MKYTLLILLILFRFTDSSATITVRYDSVGTYYYTDITDTLCGFGTDISTRMGVIVSGDNTIDNGMLSVFTYSDAGVKQCTYNLPFNGTAYHMYRDICSDDTTARVVYLYNYIRTQIPQLRPIE